MAIAEDVSLGAQVVIHHPELVNLYGCRIGEGTRIGSFVEIQKNAVVGARCKISSHSFICEGVNIACGHMLTIEEVARTVARLCQRPDLEPVHIQARPGDVYRLHADTRLAERLLGYRAEIAFEQGMEKYLAWFTRTHPDPSKLLEEDPVNWRMPDTG